MKQTMKRAFSLLLVLCMIAGLLPAVASAAEPVVYEDSFDYTAFGTASFYDAAQTWQTEYKTNTSSDYGYRASSQAQPKDGVLVMNKDNGLRLNWQKLKGFETFDASKTYTITFDVKLKDFGNNANVTGALHREFYFAPAGYYNMIEMANDVTNNIRVGDTYISSADYAVDTEYQYVVTWQPSASKMTAVVKRDGVEVASGYRTKGDFASVNKYTRSFVWRCEDGSIEVDNITFSDGTTTFTENFDREDTLCGSGIWGPEDVQRTDTEPATLENGVLKMTDKNSVRFNWTKVPNVGSYDSNKTYTFEFDTRITDVGDGTFWGPGSQDSRTLYAAFGGWYNLIEMPRVDNTVKIGSATVNFDTEKFMNQNLHIVVTLQGENQYAQIKDADGNILISGSRASSSFTDMTASNAAMTYFVLRCEDGALEIDNFKFRVADNSMLSATELEIPAGQQAVYTCKVNYDGVNPVGLNLGDTEIFSVSTSAMRLAGKAVQGAFGTGTYEIKAQINPTQKMLIVDVVKPDGGMARRGIYNRFGGTTLNVVSVNQNAFVDGNLEYTALNENEYTLVSEELVLTGFEANVYNLITAFEDARTTRTFAWAAKTSYVGADTMAVKYRAVGETEWNVTEAVKEIDGDADTDFFKADVYGLTAATTYEYKVGKKGSADESNDWGKLRTFTTAEEETDSFTFLAIGDNQSDDWNGYQYTRAALDTAFADVENPAFILNTGDHVNNAGNETQWELLFKALGDYVTETPHLATMGGHDTWETDTCSEFYYDYMFNHPNNGGIAALDPAIVADITDPATQRIVNHADETIYSFDYGDAHFVVINTGDFPDSEKALFEAQKQWLASDLAENADAKWLILLCHEPFYHRNSGSVYDNPWLRDVIETYGVDLVLQGHSHLVTRTYPMMGQKIVTKTGQDEIEKDLGTVYMTVGATCTAHDGAGDTTNLEPIYAMITPASDQPTYTAVTVEQDQLKVITKQANGAVLEAFSIKDNASEETAKITMVADPISAPVSVSYTVNGETVSTMLPAVVEVGKGDVLQVEAVACNTFDYAVTGWTQGETVLSENGTLAYTVEGDKLLTVKAERVGLTSLAEGKTVTADAVNADWAARHLTDGVVSHLGGNTGWSSKYIGKGTSFSERTAVIDFGEETVMNAFRLYGRTDSTGNASNFPTAYTIYTSSDNAQWTPVYTVTDGAVPALYVPAVIELEEAVTARYVKLGVTAVNRGDENGNVYVQLAEFGVYNDLPSDQELADQVIALIAAVDHDDKTAIDAARTAYDALSDAQKALVTNYAELEAAELYWNTVHNEVALVLSGADSVYANDGKVVYTLSAKDMNNLATVALTIDISEEFLSEPVAEPVGNWLIVAQAWKDGVLHVVAANFEGVSGDGDILTITAKPVEKAGTASVTVAAAELGAYLEEGETFVNADLDGASVNTEIQHNRFDVNKDGVVDLRDIARAQRSYGDKNTDADVNADGIVDIDDLILILNNYTDLIE